jgi:hypothetical protein
LSLKQKYRWLAQRLRDFLHRQNQQIDDGGQK